MGTDGTAILGGQPGDSYRLVRVSTGKYWIEVRRTDGVGVDYWDKDSVIDSSTPDFLWLIENGVPGS